MIIKYGSVCSGIEAASVAFKSLCWTPAWFSEIEAFPSAVLAHRWPEVKNLGDMTKIAESVLAGDVEAPDVLVGGTPCQSFSIAGLRNGITDERGQLTLSYVELANAIDTKRRECGQQESIIIWENVPGVLSSKDNAFGYFLAGLAGEDAQLQPARGRWTNACRDLDSIISKDDYYQLCALVNQAYSAGVTAGTNSARKDMREAMGIYDEH